MEIEELKEALDIFIKEDFSNRSALILLCDNEKALCYGSGKRGDLVRLLCQMLMEDSNEEFLSCLDEAMSIFMTQKKKQINEQMVRLPVSISKLKS